MKGIVAAALGATLAAALSNNGKSLWTRRQAFATAAACGTSVVACQQQTNLGPQPANAFANKISNKYDDRPKQRGSKPPSLGVLERESFDMVDDSDSGTYLGLKPCGAAPNCFCSTISLNEDAEHSIPAFVWPSDMDQAAAMTQLKDVLQAYQPTPKVDGGGFDIKTATPDYIYVQYESLKNGYIDDVEFAVIKAKRYGERQVQVRSSSRLGYLDYGVNSKRINAIAAALRAKSWNAVGVDYTTHPFYASENNLI